MAFTYEFPEASVFLYTLRELLEAEGRSDLAGLLIEASCEFSTDEQFSRIRWNSYNAQLTLRVPVALIGRFSEKSKGELLIAADKILPPEAGYELVEIRIAATLTKPPTDEGPLNNASLISAAPLEHDKLKFRSRSEIRVYDALKQRNVLFFPNPTAVLGGKGLKREPDFLVCLNGKWGILEVMGDQFHTPSNAVQDHDRARLFKDYKILLVEFYDASRCYNKPEEVVSDFLNRLEFI